MSYEEEDTCHIRRRIHASDDTILRDGDTCIPARWSCPLGFLSDSCYQDSSQKRPSTVSKET